jgi:hypothetical protein
MNRFRVITLVMLLLVLVVFQIGTIPGEINPKRSIKIVPNWLEVYVGISIRQKAVFMVTNADTFMLSLFQILSEHPVFKTNLQDQGNFNHDFIERVDQKHCQIASIVMEEMVDDSGTVVMMDVFPDDIVDEKLHVPGVV